MTREGALLAWALAALLAGLGLTYGANAPEVARWVWMGGVLPVLAGLGLEIVAGLRRGEWGLDIVAALSMTAALAVGETLAAAVVAVMYAGGTTLERLAQGRARAEMRALLERAPRQASRHGPQGLEVVPIGLLHPQDRVMVRRGEMVPADGCLASDQALLDTSTLTGEALPQRLAAGAALRSGLVNAGEAFDMIVLRPAADSTYAAIVRLVAEAQAGKAPMARLADRWSVGFLGLTLTIAGAAWALSGDPVRAVAVLVVATPCPLILAVPVALVAGLSRAASAGVLIKGAAVLEAMAQVRVLVLDKTGTLTEGRARLREVHPEAGVAPETVLQMAAALDQASQHPVAAALVAAARARGLALPVPSDVQETPGEGVTGRVGTTRVAVGTPAFVALQAGAGWGAPPPVPAPGDAVVALALDCRPAGRLVLSDPLREDAAGLLAGLRAAGVRRIVLATGDAPEVAQHAVAGLGLDRIAAGLDPAAKVAVVRAEAAQGPVMMVGDGVNDAPALAAARVGVAMGVRGAAASAEAADVVLLVDRLGPLQSGLAIARGARAIAVQSVVAGIGLSSLGMLAAAVGWLTPVQGAILQEAIDVAVILNALRVLALPVGTPRVLPASMAEPAPGARP